MNNQSPPAQASDEPMYCPFCGDSESQTVEHVEGTILHPAYFVRCDNCGAVGPTSDRGDHRQLWNSRATPRATADVERDAERYRFLRDSVADTSPWTPHGTVWVVRYNHPTGQIPSLQSAGKGEALDLHVDAAIAATKGAKP